MTSSTSTSASSSWSSSPYDSETEDLQLIERAPPFWKNTKKILSRQLSMLETERELAWEKKRHQMRMQGQKRDLTIEDPNELFDEDLNELKGCIELGFVFNEEQGGQSLANTFPALDAYFALNRLTSPTISPRSTSSSRSKFDRFGSSSSKSLDEGSLSQISSDDPWKICSPGENPQQIKTKLRHWAQLVACSVRQSSS
ncbi:hypothetical protein HanRHA438_Chr11g0514061 [Helianthus annuus]|uniref:Uncharacterized protein n=1 Tax=Helianthus annuus TaxID=4232 RepID=A0A251SIH5_HELAN|nr:uncharacterized protein LOC110903836 [Helianthus annuus]KAF5782874.1 hypothetical protein HanXRQr2_Chr11g0501371 [Helianthus annuus]KAJ0502315.1 hypothetical protein HanHA300_Chr11g0411521 [Helianthus annuus]KAJ0510352.1 hypothetical protein HanIR_Chr11g0539851 [Helianthus annuus]KAJ0518237.1 hypothetical protein HanHA89_Chr11g0435191 [Helianthus annuus]KAJ0686269.1 hypothetical protein HanLR1_Chr11g0412851 [Helianthus annuus]